MNSELIAFVSQSISTAVMNLLLFLFYKKIYEPKYSNRLLYIFSYLLTSFLFILVNQTASHFAIPLLNTVYSFIYFNVICLILFKSTIKKCFMYNILYLLVLIFIDTLTVAFGTVVKHENFMEVVSDSQYLTISCITNILVMVLVWFIFISILSKDKLATIKYKQLILLTIFSAFAAFVEYNFTLRINNSKDGIITICILLGFLFLSVLIVYFTNEIVKSYETNHLLELMKFQNAIQLEYYNEMNQKYEESRRIIHDINKHLSVLNSLNNQNDVDAKTYGKMIESQVESLFCGFQCTNKILSIIMGQKINEAENIGIKITTKIEDITLDFLDDIDITAIFANLWDNAIEACKKVSNTDRFINIIIGQINEFAVISVENSFNGQICEKNDVLLSTKEQHEGIGISIMKAAVKKYNGFINFEHDLNIFKVKLMIPVV